jgi:DNA gyrase subunit A
VLFFSSRGQVYKEKVWRLPQAAPQARGKALINILPLEQGERITTIMPLPEDEILLGQSRRDVRHHRRHVRRNKLSDFVDVRRSGIIAMKLDEGEAIVDVQICTERDDVLLTAAGGQCIRFPVTDVRVFTGPHLDGRARHQSRRGRQGDLAVDPAPCRGDAEERAAYLKRANAVRAARASRGEAAAMRGEETAGAIELGEQRYVEMSAQPSSSC